CDRRAANAGAASHRTANAAGGTGEAGAAAGYWSTEAATARHCTAAHAAAEASATADANATTAAGANAATAGGPALRKPFARHRRHQRERCCHAQNLEISHFWPPFPGCGQTLNLRRCSRAVHHLCLMANLSDLNCMSDERIGLILRTFRAQAV